MTRSDCRTTVAVDTIVLLGLVSACGGQAPATPAAQATPAAPAATAASPAAAQAPVVRNLYPDSIALGETFNEQPNGQSAIAVRVENASEASAIVFDGTIL